ncbi:MAG: hypothetical protein QNK04_34615 [Myxococcota bacterium]|nr:hypothetical protein [Myxococcota bacterium]
MGEWLFALGWLLPAIFMGIAIARFARRMRTIAKQFENPEAFAESLREAIAEAHPDAGREPGQVVVQVSSHLDASLPQRPAAPETGAHQPPLRAPYQETSGPPVLRWALVLGGVALALLAWRSL